jgi:hypothetical protein
MLFAPHTGFPAIVEFCVSLHVIRAVYLPTFGCNKKQPFLVVLVGVPNDNFLGNPDFLNFLDYISPQQ